MEVTPERGDVWWGPALFRGGGAYRPWLLVSHDSHPFGEEESIVIGLTTKEHPEGLEIDSERWVEGGSSKRSYASPWYVTTMKHGHLDRRQGALDDGLVARITHRLVSYVAPELTE